MPRYFDEFAVGEVRHSPGRTVTETDVVNFAGISGDFNPAHTDHAFAAKTSFKKPIAYGLLGLVIASGLVERDGSTDGSAIALLEVNWKFKAPIFFGDTIRLAIHVESKRLTSKGDRGILGRRIEVINQNGVVVQEGMYTNMIRLGPD